MKDHRVNPLAMFLMGFVIAGSPSHADDDDDVWLSGAIKSFECGDNCWLTITQPDGQEETGMCVAKTCVPCWENQTMPTTFVGKNVQVKLGVRWKVDGNYERNGYAISFEEVRVQ